MITTGPLLPIHAIAVEADGRLVVVLDEGLSPGQRRAVLESLGQAPTPLNGPS